MNVDTFSDVLIDGRNNRQKAKLVLSKAIFCKENAWLKEQELITRYKSKRDILNYSTGSMSRISQSMISDVMNSLESPTLSRVNIIDPVRISLSVPLTVSNQYSYTGNDLYNTRRDRSLLVKDYLESLDNSNIYINPIYSSGYYNYQTVDFYLRFRINCLTEGIFFSEAQEVYTNFLTDLNEFVSTSFELDNG